MVGNHPSVPRSTTKTVYELCPQVSTAPATMQTTLVPLEDYGTDESTQGNHSGATPFEATCAARLSVRSKTQTDTSGGG